jgi:hypothetical protein
MPILPVLLSAVRPPARPPARVRSRFRFRPPARVRVRFRFRPPARFRVRFRFRPPARAHARLHPRARARMTPQHGVPSAGADSPVPTWHCRCPTAAGCCRQHRPATMAKGVLEAWHRRQHLVHSLIDPHMSCVLLDTRGDPSSQF